MSIEQCIHHGECNKCGLCCTSISGLKYIPKYVDIKFLELNSPKDHNAYALFGDCPHVLSSGVCGIFSLRQQYPDFFKQCNSFMGGRNMFSYKLSLAILKPTENEAECILETAIKGQFISAYPILEAHFQRYSLWSFVNQYEILINTLREYQWPDTKIYEYCQKTHIHRFLQSQIIKLRLLLLIRKFIKKDKLGMLYELK